MNGKTASKGYGLIMIGKKTSDSGNVLLEFLLVFPLSLLSILVALQLILIIHARSILDYAAYRAARACLVYGDAGIGGALPAVGRFEDARGFDCIGKGKIRSEADLAAYLAAARACRMLPCYSGETSAMRLVSRVQRGVPRGNDGSERRADSRIGWRVRSELELDYPLRVPVAGPILSRLLSVRSEEPVIKLRAGCCLNKPYRTLIPTGFE